MFLNLFVCDGSSFPRRVQMTQNSEACYKFVTELGRERGHGKLGRVKSPARQRAADRPAPRMGRPRMGYPLGVEIDDLREKQWESSGVSHPPRTSERKKLVRPLRTMQVNRSILPSWQAEPCAHVSWWDMEKFSAHVFFAISRVLQTLSEYEPTDPKEKVNPDSKVIDDWLTDLRSQCDAIGLRLSSRHVSRAIERGKTGEMTVLEWKKMIPELHSRIHDEMEQNLFMYVPPVRAERYDKMEAFGPEVAKNFQTASFDITESGNCFASARYTACVFHLMRVLEIGLIAFAKIFPNVPTNRENWQQIIERIELEIREMPKVALKAPDWKEKQEKYSQVASSFMFFKDAWRNYTAHARGKYTEDESDAIYRNVRSFMQGIAAQGIKE